MASILGYRKETVFLMILMVLATALFTIFCLSVMMAEHRWIHTDLAEHRIPFAGEEPKAFDGSLQRGIYIVAFVTVVVSKCNLVENCVMSSMFMHSYPHIRVLVFVDTDQSTKKDDNNNNKVKIAHSVK